MKSAFWPLFLMATLFSCDKSTDKSPEERKILDEKHAAVADSLAEVKKAQECDCTQVPCVAVTFDDGPGPYTEQILDILKQNDAHATFYVLGKNVLNFPHILQRTHAEGHDIGNHSWDHKNLKSLSAEKVAFEVNETNAQVQKTIGKMPTSFRPPYGSYSKKTADIANMPVIIWSVDTNDWRYRTHAHLVKAVQAAKANDVILMHDIHKNTMETLPDVLKILKDKGLHIVSVETLFKKQGLKPKETYGLHPDKGPYQPKPDSTAATKTAAAPAPAKKAHPSKKAVLKH